eukprot:804635-Alexandrium_andersonii.AAC.1
MVLQLLTVPISSPRALDPGLLGRGSSPMRRGLTAVEERTESHAQPRPRRHPRRRPGRSRRYRC